MKDKDDEIIILKEKINNLEITVTSQSKKMNRLSVDPMHFAEKWSSVPNLHPQYNNSQATQAHIPTSFFKKVGWVFDGSGQKCSNWKSPSSHRELSGVVPVNGDGRAPHFPLLSQHPAAIFSHQRHFFLNHYLWSELQPVFFFFFQVNFGLSLFLLSFTSKFNISLLGCYFLLFAKLVYLTVATFTILSIGTVNTQHLH